MSFLIKNADFITLILFSPASLKEEGVEVLLEYDVLDVLEDYADVVGVHGDREVVVHRLLRHPAWIIIYLIVALNYLNNLTV